MKLLFALLFLTLPAHGADFLTTDTLTCKKLSELYSKNQLSKMNPLFLDSVECSVDYRSVRIRKDLVRAFYPAFSEIVEKIDKSSEDQGAPLMITGDLQERCVVQTEKAQIDLVMACNFVEKALK